MSYKKYLMLLITITIIAITFVTIAFLPLIIAKIVTEKTKNEMIMYIGVAIEILWIPLILKIIDYIWEKT
jgi:hypothetical protein